MSEWEHERVSVKERKERRKRKSEREKERANEKEKERIKGRRVPNKILLLSYFTYVTIFYYFQGLTLCGRQ